MYGALNISTSGMIAQRIRMDVISSNIANAGAVTNDRGEPDAYRRRFALLAPEGENGALGVRVAEIGLDEGPFRKVYDPMNPLAADVTDPSRDMVEGYVNFPNVDPAVEMVNMVEASRAYEANVMAAEASKAMFDAAMGLIA